MSIRVQVSLGEFLDKLSILRIKAQRIRNAVQRANVERELSIMQDSWRQSPYCNQDLNMLIEDLQQVNEELWDIEDDIRAKEAAQCFDEEFIRLARAVYRTNDRRAAIKRALNLRLGSELVEEKSYTHKRAP